MITARTLILGSAAGLIAMSGAQAADLPVKAKAVEYVRICSLYGAGFFYIPGTDTCIKIGGYLRADVTFNGAAHGGPAWNSDLGQQNRYRDYFVARSRLALTVDTRTATEYGVVRTFGQGDFQFNNFGSSNPTTLSAFPGGVSNSLSTAGGGYVAVEYLFIQFAGFTFGKSSSAYSTPWNGFPGNINSSLLGGNNTDTGVNNIQYTAEFGNGVSASIGLDDPTVWNRTAVYNLGIPSAIGANGTGSNAYAGTHAPDIVGRIRVDQAWGLFQLSAAAHEVNGSYNTLGAGGVPTALSEISGHPETKWGGSVMAALQIKNLPTGAGDDIKIDASYAKGTTKNVIATSGTSPNFAMFGDSGFGYQSVGFGATTDGVYMPGRRRYRRYRPDDGLGRPRRVQSQLGSVLVDRACSAATRLSGMTAARTTICWVREPPRPRALTAPPSPLSHPGQALAGNAAGNYTCNPDFNVSQLGVSTRWTPGQEPDVLGRSAVVPSRPEDVGLFGVHGDRSEAERALRVQGSGHRPAPGPRPA